VLAVLLITIVIAFFTEFASNTATIIIFLPVLAELVRVLLGQGEGITPPVRVRNLPGMGLHPH
jgi:di/tricarboxylate transporter